MTKIIVNDKRLNENTILEIVVSTAHSKWPRESDGIRTDYYRNKDVLAAYEADEVLTAEQLAHRFYVTGGDKSWSLQFYALRAGEAINWAIEHEIVEPVGEVPAQSWRLRMREQQFELVGAIRRQRAVRVRGLHGAGAIAADKLWKRELTRRRKEQAKLVEKYTWEAEVDIKRILENDPLHLLSDELGQFRIGSVLTIAGAREMILDTFRLDTEEREMLQVRHALERCWRASIPIREARRREEAAHVPSEDYAMLGELDL